MAPSSPPASSCLQNYNQAPPNKKSRPAAGNAPMPTNIQPASPLLQNASPRPPSSNQSLRTKPELLPQHSCAGKIKTNLSSNSSDLHDALPNPCALGPPAPTPPTLSETSTKTPHNLRMLCRLFFLCLLINLGERRSPAAV